MRKTLTALGALALAGAASWPLPAAAQQDGAFAYVYSGWFVEYRAGDGQTNDVTVTQGTEAFTYVVDDVVPIEVGEGCTHPDETDLTHVACTLTDPQNTVVNARLGDGDDRGEARGEHLIGIHGQAGDDVLTGEADDEIFGGTGRDTLSGTDSQFGGPGSDTHIGTAGNDFFDPGKGDDTILGQGGDDTVEGTEGADDIHGDAGNDTLHGGADDDIVHGGDGADTLYGGPGDDVLDGGPGDDEEHQD
jgi:Ca2+-binding RTX toxin-like protein